MNDATLLKTYQARNAYVASLGTVDPNPIPAPPDDGLAWPGLRRGWRVIRRPTGATAVISDGLSDPYPDAPKPNPGLGIEVIAETATPLATPVEQSWLFQLVYHLSQQCVEHGGFRNLIDKLGLICLELPMDDRAAGVLLGVNPPDFLTAFDTPGGTVKVITVRRLSDAELTFAGERGQASVAELATRFAREGTFHRSPPP